MAYRMRFVVVPTGKTPDGKPKWVNAKGVAECVMLVQQAAGAPVTSAWRAGLAIRNAIPGEIPPYTAIATFATPDGRRADTPDQRSVARYPTDSLGKHAALYLSHNAQEIRVIEQWAALGEAKERIIKFNNPDASIRSREGNWFHVIEPG
jgi:hypothetical protein